MLTINLKMIMFGISFFVGLYLLFLCKILKIAI